MDSATIGAPEAESGTSEKSLSAIVGSFVFLSAFLAFLVQPLAARYLLPKFGGGSSVWTVCLVFFQATLTLGYAYAHLIARVLSVGHQQKLHAALLIVSTATIPILSGESVAAGDGEDPAMQLLWFLLRHLGLSYLLLCGTSPLVQSWYGRIKGGATYRLYRLSNFGSLLGLLAYPFVLEPLFGLADQRWIWSALYVALVLISVACWRAFTGVRLSATRASEAPSEPSASAPNFARLMWLLIPACASVLLLATSSRLTQDIAPVPLLWVLPIGLYLYAFALAFSDRPGFGRGVWIALAGASLMGTMYVMQLEQAGDSPSVFVRFAVYMSPVFFVCRAMFGELFRLRPPTTRLTSYYLTISVGGAMGGAFVGLVAPRIFSGYWELPIALCASGILMALCVLASSKPGVMMRRPFSILAWIGVLAFIEISLLEHTRSEMDGAQITRRGFYGVLSIYERGEGTDHKFTLYHGNISHGVQFVDDELLGEPTTYYSRTSGVGLTLTHHAMKKLPGRRIGAIGLGTGTVAAYGRPADVFRFYEIDPLVVEIARDNFTYLANTEADVELAIGDARVSLQREFERDGSQRFDVLIVDAFSGDSIPVHLLTREAFELYWKHLEPDGVLLIHTSNRYVELAPVARALAHEAGFDSVEVVFDGHDDEDDYEEGEGDDDEGEIAAEAQDAARFIPPGPADYRSDWVVITRDQTMLEIAAEYTESDQTAGLDDPLAIWTDDHNHLLHAMELFD